MMVNKCSICSADIIKSIEEVYFDVEIHTSIGTRAFCENSVLCKECYFKVKNFLQSLGFKERYNPYQGK